MSVRVVKADEPWPEGPELLADVDGIVMFLSEGASWCQADPRRYEASSRLASHGGGIVAMHWAIGLKAAEPIAGICEVAGRLPRRPGPQVPGSRDRCAACRASHPIATGLQDFRIRDEFYYQLKFVTPATASIRCWRPRSMALRKPCAWAYERPDGGRSFGFSGLHFHDNWDRPEYRTLVTQAVRWSVKLPVK